MPVPFRDADEAEAPGAAGYLKIDASQDGGMLRSALFPVNARGEPVESTYEDMLPPYAALLISHGGPLEWPGILFPYQMEGIQELMSRDALLLADDMGLGKTVQVVAALRVLLIQRRIEAALVVARAGLLKQWRQEIRTWAPELRTSTIHGPAAERAYQWSTPAHVYLVSYETLRSDFTDNPASPPRRRTWDVVVLDEAQQIKNPKTDVSRKCKLLLRKKAWALTGTPLENRLDDLASILEFVSPFGEGDEPLQLQTDDAMLKRHRQLQLRRKKVDVLAQLPPKITNRILLALPDSQYETYKAAEERGVLELQGMGEAVRIENVLELILRLKQICNFCPRTGQSAKLEDVRERLSTLVSEGHRALVFSQFVDARFGVKAVASGLTEFNALSYTGSLASVQREAIIRAFKEDTSHKILVLSLRAGGVGLNLQDASYVFHFDRWWNPAVEHQAEDRSHRMGQSSPVHVYKYICEGTIEERIDQILQQKQLLFDEIVDDVSIDLRARLTAEELFGLFGLSPPGNSSSSKSSLRTPERDSEQRDAVVASPGISQYGSPGVAGVKGTTGKETAPQPGDQGEDHIEDSLEGRLWQRLKLGGVEPAGREVLACPAEPLPCDYTPEFFFQLAKWAKERGTLEPWQRRFAYGIAMYLMRGHQLSERQKRVAVPIIQEAIKKGFSGPEGIPNASPLEGRAGIPQPDMQNLEHLPNEAYDVSIESSSSSESNCGIHCVESGYLSLPLSWVYANSRPARVGIIFWGDKLIITADGSWPEWRGVRYGLGTATMSLPRKWLGDAQKVVVVSSGKNLEVTRLTD